MLYKAPRGTSDILPEDQAYWRYIESKVAEISQVYGFQRIDTPVFEDAGLFVRGIGEETDIVEKEMYSFEDRSGDLITLRPEGTAPVCRAYLQHGMHNLPQPVKLYYITPIFRYERPQAGRYRQHWQFGFEAIGVSDPALDAEIIEMSWRLYYNLGLRDLVLKLNSIGCRNCRPSYLGLLKEYYAQRVDSLCADCKRRFDKNTLRLLDCKNDLCTGLTEQAPKSTDHLCDDCKSHFEQLKKSLSILGLPFDTDHRLVRGLDYYTKTVFEIQPPGAKGAQSTIGGGGRYDDLIEEIGGKSTPAVGFATGFERMILNMRNQNIDVPSLPKPSILVSFLGEEAKDKAIEYASRIRQEGISAILASGNRSLKSQMKQANTMEADYIIIVGEEELKAEKVLLRDMNNGQQEQLDLTEVIKRVRV